MRPFFQFSLKVITVAVIIVMNGCHQKQKEITTESVRAMFGEFEPGQLIKLRPVDVTGTPVYRRIEHHPDQYSYLNDVEIFSLIYDSDGLMVTGLLVKPKAVHENTPVIVYNRGGNQEMGRLLVEHAVEIFAPLAAEGFIVAASNYRGNSGSEGQEQFGGEDVNDVLNLIEAVGQIPEADISRVGMLGLSRGGMMTYLALKNDSEKRIKAVANLGGITDLAYTIEHHPEIGEVCEWLIPDYTGNEKKELEKRSAIKWVDQLPTDVPILILHGTADQSVDYGQIPVFTECLTNYGIPHKAVIYQGDNHGCVAHRQEVMTNLKEWFKSTMIDQVPYTEFEFTMVED
ncbi:MAG: prolyl oligopeptidase family serine peptidase [Marinoscillum sp.]